MFTRNAFATLVALFACTPAPSHAVQEVTELDPVYVTAPMPNEYGCQYCWVLAGYGDGGANGGSGGSGNIALAYSATGAIVVPDSDHNQENEANCSSIEAVRLNHALQDVNAFVSGMTIWRRIALADQRMHVSYTDGSTEEWVYSGSTGDAALVPFPVQGTIKCE